MGVLVPAYFDPGTYWDRLIAQASKMPGKIIAIANVVNGPGAVKYPEYADAINNFRANGGIVIGYVDTEYAARSSALVENDIDVWFSYYTIDGIFLDQQPSTSGSESYYQSIYNYAKTKGSGTIVMTNAGTNTVESYLFYDGSRISDIICILETHTGFPEWEPAGWISKYDSTSFCVLLYSAGADDYEAYTEYTVDTNIGWLYCTDDSLPNPWDTLPDYFEEFSAYAAAAEVAEMAHISLKSAR